MSPNSLISVIYTISVVQAGFQGHRSSLTGHCTSPIHCLHLLLGSEKEYVLLGAFEGGQYASR